MGHERTGTLPKTRRWTQVVQDIASFRGDEEQSLRIANTSLENVRSRFESVQRDSGVHAAFRFLIPLSVSGSGIGGGVGQLSRNPTPFAIARAFEPGGRRGQGLTRVRGDSERAFEKKGCCTVQLIR